MKKLMFCLALAGLQALQVRDVQEVKVQEFIVVVPEGIDAPLHISVGCYPVFGQLQAGIYLDINNRV